MVVYFVEQFRNGVSLGLIFLIVFPVAFAFAIDKLGKHGFVSLAPYLASGALLIGFGIAIGALLRAVYICFVMRKSTNTILKHNKLTISPAADILIIRESGDEASNLLGALQIVVGVFSKLFTCIEEWATALEGWSTKVSEAKITWKTLLPNIVTFLVALAAVVLLTPNSVGLPLHTKILLIGLLLVLCGVFFRSILGFIASLGYNGFFGMALAFCWAPLLPVWLVSSLVIFPLREELFSAILLNVSAEATPEGLWSVHHFVPESSALAGLRLAHSAAHDDPRVFKLVADWLVSRGAVEKAAPASSFN